MKKATTYEAAFKSVLLFFCYVLAILFCYTLSAQNSKTTFSEFKATEKQKKDYRDLKNLGYTDKEIYEDLGNVYFMSKKYETAVFWYAHLKKVQKNG
ncbi:MAG: cell envelope biogenesis protein OmpA, partial [Flavobacteriaceae bacterium]